MGILYKIITTTWNKCNIRNYTAETRDIISIFLVVGELSISVMADDLESAATQGQVEADVHHDEAQNADANNLVEVQSTTEGLVTDLAEENDVTEDILQQALAEASAGNLDHIDQSNIDAAELLASEGTDPNGTLADISQNVESASTVEVAPKESDADKGHKESGRAPPLGSKSNPIRIIQQGNTYTSMQHLSQNQIQQIVQVLQQQNIASKGLDGASTAVFNPETNTRIVYRVVQPHGAKKSDTSDEAGGTLTARQYHESKYGKTYGSRYFKIHMLCKCVMMRCTYILLSAENEHILIARMRKIVQSQRKWRMMVNQTAMLVICRPLVLMNLLQLKS